MALNVNIIGRDSEGNLQALKVNSEGNLEISDSLGWGELLQDISDELELVKAELQTIKANQLSGDQKVTLSGIIPEPSVNAEITLSIEPGQSYTLYEGSGEEAGRFAGLVVVARNPTNNPNDLLIDIRFARSSTYLDDDYYALWHERLTTANEGIFTAIGAAQGISGTQIKSRFIPLLRTPFKISVSAAPGGSTVRLLGLRAYFYNQRV